MARFEVTTTSLDDMANDIDQQTKDLRNVLDEAQSLVKSMAGEIWDSDAYRSFDAQFSKLYSNLQQFDVVLNGYSNFLRESASIYTTTDQKAMDDTNVLNSDSLFTR